MVRNVVVTLATLALTSSLHAQWLEPDVEVLFDFQHTTPSDLFGWTAVPIGDADGDGAIDIAVSYSFAFIGGRVTAFSGATGAQIWTRTETLPSSVLGYAMETVDWNGDGQLDVVAGAPFNGAGGGRVHVYDGADGATLHTLDPTDSAGDNFGVSIAVGGDFNGDGTPDIAVGTLGDDTGGENAGRVYIFSVGTGAMHGAISGTVIDGEFGIGLAFVGDVNGDGDDEIVVGQRLADFWSGEALVYGSAGLGGIELLYTVDDVGMGYNIIGDRIDGGRDVSGDGVPDFCVGDMFAGEVAVCSGVDGSRLYTIYVPGEEGDLAPAHFIDDVTGDGRADLIVGSWGSNAGVSGGGRVFIVSGADGTIVRTMTHMVVNGRAASDVRAAGDFNGDGAMDFLIGATGGGFNGPPPGRVFVLAGTPVDLPADLNGDGVVDVEDLLIVLASWGGAGGDVNGDGVTNVEDLLLVLSAW